MNKLLEIKNLNIYWNSIEDDFFIEYNTNILSSKMLQSINLIK